MNVSEERALFPEHNGGKSHIFSSFNTTSTPVVLNLFPSDEGKSERELEKGRG